MSLMENVDDLSDAEVEKYFDKNYFIKKFTDEDYFSRHSPVEFELPRQRSFDEPSTHNFTMDDTLTQENIEISVSLWNTYEVIKAESFEHHLHSEMNDTDEQQSRNLRSSEDNFTDAIVRSSKTIERLEKIIEYKNNILLDSEKTIKMLFTQTMALQKQVLTSHKATCDYMTEDLRSVGSLLGRRDKPVEKIKLELEAALWEKENEKTQTLMSNLKEYFSKTLEEVFSKNYENLRNVPIFTLLLSDNISILHKQFFDHYNELYIRGQVNTGFIKSLQDGFTRLKFNVNKKFTLLTERTNNIFRCITQENHLINRSR